MQGLVQVLHLELKLHTMKRSYFILFLATLTLLGCKKEGDGIVFEDHIEAFDSYLLTEILADPGDGSGTFQPVNSEKVVELHPDGTITSNGDLCRMTNEIGVSSTGTYSLVDSTFSSADCNDISFELNGNEMIVYYQCIEACRGKFLKQE
jgi:hypothetical protein